MSKKSTYFKVKADAPEVSEALFKFFVTHSKNINDYVTHNLRSSGIENVDVSIKPDFNKKSISIESLPKDKGSVLYLENDKDLIVSDYKNLTEGKHYVTVKDGQAQVYVFNEGEKADNLVGIANSMDIICSELPRLDGQYKKIKEQRLKESTVIEDAEIVEDSSDRSSEKPVMKVVRD